MSHPLQAPPAVEETPKETAAESEAPAPEAAAVEATAAAPAEGQETFVSFQRFRLTYF